MPYGGEVPARAIRLGSASEHGGVTTAPRSRLALAGAVTGLAGIAVAHVLTDVLNARATPVQVVAELVIDKTPGGLAESLIQLVGRNDKPILVGGVTAAILLLGALAGVLTSRRRILGQLVFWAMAAVAGAAALTRPDFTPYSLLPLAGGVVVWTLLLDHLTGTAQPRPTLEDSRRRFLLNAGGVTVAALVVAQGGRLFGRTRKAVEASRSRLRLPVSRGVVPAGASTDLAGLTPWRVPTSDFYRIDTALVVPSVEPAEWRLRVHGMVDRELTLTYQDLLDRELTEDWVTICCVSNEVGGDLIGNAWWSGVRIADVLAEAGVRPGADAVKQTSEDGWTCGTPVAALTDDRNAMLAVAMNGRPLPVEHGFPVRMIVPGLYGYVSATKWLVDLEVTTFDSFQAYWTQNGWSEKGPVKTQSRVEVPRSGADVTAGTVRVGGHAWAQHTGIEKVEYRLDGAAWQTAELGRVPGADTWVQWAGTVQAPRGEHTLAVRATDRSGYTQTPVRVDVVPDGATGWHKVDFSAS
jgi:DMSO/TMAO reductase YedYZ molybdopterin-dependent catalytic subunit